jgi:flagellar biosynthesis/type III secretory pathway protein FliH
MRARSCFAVGFTAMLAAMGFGLQPASAQDLNRIVGTLNAILNPQDALHLEERARREGREEEERYWRDYRAGLEQRPPGPPGTYAQPYREGFREGYEIGAEEAHRYEEEARRRHRIEEERYWRAYRAGLEHGRDQGRARYAIGPEEARRLEEQARLRHRWEEAGYWRNYRAGLIGGPPPRDPDEYPRYPNQRYR